MTPTASASTCIHPGSYPPGNATVGTNDPAIWLNLLVVDGEIWVARLNCDVLSHVPTIEELSVHFERWRGPHVGYWQKLQTPAQ